MYSEHAAHTCGLSDFEEICNGPVRLHLQSREACMTGIIGHQRFNFSGLVYPFIYISDTAACLRGLSSFEDACDTCFRFYLQSNKACTNVRNLHQLLPLLVTP